MFKQSNRFFTILVVGALVLAPAVSHASVFDRLSAVQERLQERQERMTERIETKKEKIEEKKQEFAEKAEAMRERAEERRDKIQERVCDRLENGPDHSTPPFCDDDEPEPEAPTLTLTADPASIVEGESSTLSWESEFATDCTASDAWSGAQPLTGDTVVMPDVTSDYTLECTGEGGMAMKSVTVTVTDGDTPTTTTTVYDVVVDDDRFDTLETLVDLALLDGALDDDAASWTVFAPTDDAFALLPTSTVEALVANPTTTLADVLLYHVYDGEIAEADIPAGVTPLVMANGDTATVTASGTVMINDANVIETDIMTDNGIIHIIDMVIVPPADPDPEPEPTLDHLVISEVLYDLGDGQGSESGGDNEWVEIYNPTDAAVDLMDWEIGDGSSNDVISDTTLTIAPGEFVVITDATTTADFWDFSGVTVVYLGSSISGGLANGGDVVKLFDASDSEVDAVSYDANVDAFDPSVSGVAAGSSIERIDPDTDTDTAADWVEQVSPTPGA